MEKLNCLILDDHPLVGIAIKSLVLDLKYVESVEILTDANKSLAKLKEGSINLLILDVNLGDCDGFDFYRRIKSHGYKGKVLFFSAEQSYLFSEMAFKLGADGYVCKSEEHSILRDAIEGIYHGYTFFKFKQNARQVDRQKKLSSREVVVMNYLLQGKNNKEIAALLSISDKTVSTYKKRIFDKYSVSNIIELTKVTVN
ncbi:response regulator transcription factor [Vibrio hippocampi]|uniref:DNA-binding transcriptional activator EvgA n=1 Tax=Vibrio hippocampi TaxID=654686 RepID=A0ABM8ZNT1_9VIBR|nr:response regulator transcription factor [Vibrio hippocampi]CAH0530032.1 DNA-binding transcriptional activator EvgA [Vibrio hippocampi]